jgi:hypothetical protein
MSAFAIRVEEDRVYVFTDAVWADRDGIITGFGPMFHAFPHWPAMVLVCGPGQLARAALAEMTQRFDSIDALATSVTDFMVETSERQAALLKAALLEKAAADFQIIAAGWSRRQKKPRVLVARPSDTGRGYALYEHHKTLLSTALPREALFFAGRTEEEIEATDPVAYALATLGGMRAMHLLGLGGPAVGGYLLISNVNADGIFQVRQPVKDWESDCIGLRIGEDNADDALRLPRIEEGPLTFGVPPGVGQCD